jgi:hypothetical protein
MYSVHGGGGGKLPAWEVVFLDTAFIQLADILDSSSKENKAFWYLGFIPAYAVNQTVVEPCSENVPRSLWHKLEELSFQI